VATGVRDVYETGSALPEVCRPALRDLVVACADTKLLMGYHYGEWTFGTPTLEAAVAHCSLAQSELGHVRLLHGILKSHFDEDLDGLVEGRPAEAFACVAYLAEPLPDWPAVVAMNLVVDLAVTRVIHSMRESAFLPMRACAAKLLDEERYHAHHGHGWFRALAGQLDDRERVAECVREALADTRTWYGPDTDGADRALVDAGVKAASNADLAAALHGDIARAAAAHGLEVAVPSAPEAASWTAARRRAGGNGPSEEVLYHLRGTKNAMFKLT
jgi:ring-1,2-phenylacetyl-CoA epoxidase subunit PaaC